MSITVTDNAKSRIAAICNGAPFRIGVDGGKCQGFQYILDVAVEVGAEDEVFDFDGVSVVVDRVSLPYLLGSQLDYISSLVGERFEVSNPNATSTCGCGTSFSV
ncbi:iron-sulfur cluster assembly accessory protein [Pararhizobium sp. BT-229]|uniref:HesB/IscA family protein n=1 Tax=Pararhizobium sp. BT-229 TaxID=2986923 RepID=UPI0021F71D37|nr:iron-sulfur cluster assembly accessory protein [Pararhizobium sp. BT-229]MCV9964659.1 iron-sulfur cluster assembly accessory protein [Pararhizobium sp. BT-229]